MGHSVLGPSSAERWLSCSGSVALSQGIVEKSSEFADEGTAYHYLAAHCLNNNANAEDHIGRKLWVDEFGEVTLVHDGVLDRSTKTREFVIDRTDADYVQVYIDYVRLAAFNNKLWVEQEVPIDHLTQEQGGMGTADAIIYNEDQRELIVVDLKFGRGVEVSAVDNMQMRVYALGALEKFAEEVSGVREVRMVIVQPRAGDGKPQEWVIPIEQLHEFGNKVKRGATTVWAALDLYNELVSSGADIASDVFQSWCDQYLLVTEKGCQWCKAKAKCPKIAKDVAQTTGADFEDLTQESLPVVIDELPNKHPNQDLANKMLKADLIEGWIKAVRAEVEAELMAGREVPHYKLVQGKKGNRAWQNEDEAIALLKKMRLKAKEMYDQSVKSPTKITALLKDTPKRLERVQEIITQADGKISVAHESDKRDAVNITPTAAGMEAEVDVEESFV